MGLFQSFGLTGDALQCDFFWFKDSMASVKNDTTPWYDKMAQSSSAAWINFGDGGSGLRQSALTIQLFAPGRCRLIRLHR